MKVRFLGSDTRGGKKKDILKRKTNVISQEIQCLCITWIFFFVSFDYEDAGYQTAELVKMDILLNGNTVEELVTIVHK